MQDSIWTTFWVKQKSGKIKKNRQHPLALQYITRSLVTYSEHDGVGQLDIVDGDSGNESYQAGDHV